MISKKIFAPDGSNTRFLSDFIIRSEQFTRVYNYVYDAGGVDGTVDGATGLFVRVLDAPKAPDLITIDKWDLVDNSISFYTAPKAGTRVYIEVATTPEEFGTTLIEPAVERAETAADAAEASEIAAAASEAAAALSEAAAALSETNAAASAAAALASQNAAALSETNASASEVAAGLSEAAAALSEAAAALSETNAASSETAAGLSETNSAASAAAAAARAVAAEASEIAAKASEDAVAADLILTNADVVLTHADAAQTALDRVATGADATATALDKIATNADAAATALDKIATNADVVITNADVVTTNTNATNSQLRAWEAEAEKMTADSYATEAEDVFVNSWASDGDGTFTATPTTDYSALHYSAKAENGLGLNPEVTTLQIGGEYISPYSMRNKLINGGFDIWQRGTSFDVSPYTYTADRWKTWNDSGRAIKDTNGVLIKKGSAGGYATLGQVVSDDEISIIGRELTATVDIYSITLGTVHTMAILESDNNITYSPLTSTPIVAGKNSLTFTPTKKYLVIYCYFSHGGDSSANMVIKSVQLEEGSVATPFEQRPIGMELALCQRYYQQVYVSQFSAVLYVPNGDTRGNDYYFSKMRRTPSISPSSFSTHSINFSTSGETINTPTVTWNVSVNSAGGNHFSFECATANANWGGNNNVVVLGSHCYTGFKLDAEL